MVTISPTLRDKIERRSRRAWRRKADGDPKRRFHRISNIKENSLSYRVPYTPDYYGKEMVEVVIKDDGSVVVDPPTTGMNEARTSSRTPDGCSLVTSAANRLSVCRDGFISTKVTTCRRLPSRSG